MTRDGRTAFATGGGAHVHRLAASRTDAEPGLELHVRLRRTEFGDGRYRGCGMVAILGTCQVPRAPLLQSSDVGAVQLLGSRFRLADRIVRLRPVRPGGVGHRDDATAVRTLARLRTAGGLDLEPTAARAEEPDEAIRAFTEVLERIRRLPTATQSNPRGTTRAIDPIRTVGLDLNHFTATAGHPGHGRLDALRAPIKGGCPVSTNGWWLTAADREPTRDDGCSRSTSGITTGDCRRPTGGSPRG